MAAKKRRRARRLTGILPTIGMILIASALFRLGSGTGVAFAQAAVQATTPAADQPAPDEPVPALIQALKKREADLEARELEAAERLRTAERAEALLQEKLVALEAAEARLSEKIRIAETGAQEDVARLTEVYARMKPKSAAALFSEMDPSFAAGFLARMNADAAAAILAGMEPDMAYTISVVLAGRNANELQN